MPAQIPGLSYKCPPDSEVKRAIMKEVGRPPLDTRLDDAAAGLRGQGGVSLRGALVDVMATLIDIDSEL